MFPCKKCPDPVELNLQGISHSDLIKKLYGCDHFNPYDILNVPRRPKRRNDSSDQFESDSSKFQVMLNVKHFQPDEINVKTVDNFVVIHCKHEEYADEHGFVSREFTRRYQLPDDVEPEKVKSFLRNGVLRIEAQRKLLEPPPMNEIIVPINIET